MEWHEVGIAFNSGVYEFVDAADFCDGVLVKIECSIVYVPGYQIKLKDGDADCNTLRPRS